MAGLVHATTAVARTAANVRSSSSTLGHVEEHNRSARREVRGGAVAWNIHVSYFSRMKTVPATEAKNRFGAMLDAAQREPVVIRRQERDVAVLLSMADYERLRSANIRALLDLRDEVAAEAARAGLTEKRLAKLLGDDGA